MIEETPLVLKIVVLELGTHAWIIQANDSHWFKLNESPTNIIFFPLHFSKKFNPLNLQLFKNHPQIQILCFLNTKVHISFSFVLFVTWVEHSRRAASDTSGTTCRDAHTFGNWTVDLQMGKSKRRTEGKQRRKPISPETGCIFRRVFWVLRGGYCWRFGHLFGGDGGWRIVEKQLGLRNPLLLGSDPLLQCYNFWSKKSLNHLVYIIINWREREKKESSCPMDPLSFCLIKDQTCKVIFFFLFGIVNVEIIGFVFTTTKKH